ncbi:hypothetical protein [Alkalihalobacillus sp. BA299]|uniref:hypothetical protein n=1 Tax=Alkalihalobacillus sp. BA299 TaxID=2815938 RepID=UPI001ADB07D0|nr:hypothetical protein [Alkalihalobacillus sp. BA299]
MTISNWESNFKKPMGAVCVLNPRLPQKVMKVGFLVNDRIYSTWELAYNNHSTYLETPHQCVTLQDYIDDDIADLSKSYSAF